MTNLPKLLEIDIVQFAGEYEGERFNAILCDPPYALISVAKRFGKPGSAPAQEDGMDGSFARLSKGFMGQSWDSFESLDQYRDWVKTWAKLLIDKMLHPGAICLFFGGTRTWHHLAVGLEAGGFEVYDTLLWLYGSGFPKSHDISKGIDDGEPEDWDGYGTALKPAWEPILLCRAPRKGATFASLALEHGSGALNIDGGRIGILQGDDINAKNPQTFGGFGHAGAQIYGESKGDQYRVPSGRWPANLLLSHHEDCKLVGSTRVPARVINRWEEGAKPFGGAGGLGLEYQSDYTGDDEGMETIERWACVPECPIRQLDDQVGDLDIVGGPKHTHSPPNIFGGGAPSVIYLDTGGPSRFFYCGKASRTEKDKGLENWFWKRTPNGFERVSEDEWRCLPRRERAKGNIHPTVKPLELLRYLALLIKPPDIVKSRLLVPFSGSGSECIAAHQAGWDEVVGVEISALYNEMAAARMRGTLGML